MAGVEAYARGDYLRDLMRGRSDTRRSIGWSAVTELTGLDPRWCANWAGGSIRVPICARFIATTRRSAASTTPTSPPSTLPLVVAAASNDPLDLLIAPTTSAMVDFVTREVGGRPIALSRAVL
jgi:hypothetical protein